MTVPYTFGTATTSIPLSNLDANFNTPITLGNTSIYLGNTTTTIGNLTLTNVTISSGTANITSNITYATANAVVFTNSSGIGTTNSSLSYNGTNLLTITANSSELILAGGSSAAQGGFLTISRGGTSKILIGTASNVIGGGSNTSDDLTLFATANTRFYASSTESMRLTSTGLGIGTISPAAPLDIGGNPTYQNQMIWSRGVTDTDFKAVLTSGDTGTQASIGSIGARYSNFKDFASIQFYRNSAVGNLLFFTGGLAGDGTEKMRITGTGVLDIGTGAGAVGQIQFPATQVPSANANTLDDYEEGTWTPTQGGNLTIVGTFSSSGSYTKIGRFVVARGILIGSTSAAFTGGSPAILCAGLPFTSAEAALGNAVDNNFNQGIVCTPSSTNVYGSSAITATGSITFSVSYFV
jgi:hypothetical protein